RLDAHQHRHPARARRGDSGGPCGADAVRCRSARLGRAAVHHRRPPDHRLLRLEERVPMEPVHNTALSPSPDVALSTGETIRSNAGDRYKYGFVTEIESERAPKGLNEDTIRFISAKKNEPDWLLEWRLRAYRLWT